MDYYIREIFKEQYQNDGLTIMGHGLGIELLFSKFVQLYSDKKSVGKRLVLCMNSNEIENSIQDLLFSQGIRPEDLPTVRACNACAILCNDFIGVGDKQ